MAAMTGSDAAAWPHRSRARGRLGWSRAPAGAGACSQAGTCVPGTARGLGSLLSPRLRFLHLLPGSLRGLARGRQARHSPDSPAGEEAAPAPPQEAGAPVPPAFLPLLLPGAPGPSRKKPLTAPVSSCAGPGRLLDRLGLPWQSPRPDLAERGVGAGQHPRDWRWSRPRGPPLLLPRPPPCLASPCGAPPAASSWAGPRPRRSTSMQSWGCPEGSLASVEFTAV